MENSFFNIHSAKSRFERLLGWSAVYRDYFLAQDETTQRINRVLHENPWHVYPNSSPESGSHAYSSLDYPTAEIAKASFARKSHSLVYGRDGTPDGDTLTEVLLQLDTAAVAGRVTAHGMSAIEAALLAASSGEHIVASRHIFGTTKKNLQNLVRERNISVTFVDGRNPEEWERAIQPGRTRLFFFEPVGNPGMEVANTQALAAIAHKHDREIIVVSDNSMTPLDQSLSKGADIVAFSTTKFLGLGRDNGGAILISKYGIERLSRVFDSKARGYPVLTSVSRKGLTQSHRCARAMLKNAPLSVLRHQRQIATASQVARGLSSSTSVKVSSPVLNHPDQVHAESQVFSLDLGDQESAFRFINMALRAIQWVKTEVKKQEVLVLQVDSGFLCA